MPLPGHDVLSSPAPVVRRWTWWCLSITMLSSGLAVAFVIVRKSLGVPNSGWVRFAPLVLGLAPIVIIAPLWWWRTRWVRRAVRESGWRLCPYCAYNLSTLGDAGVCPECGNAFDIESDARFWEDIGVKRPAEHPSERDGGTPHEGRR